MLPNDLSFRQMIEFAASDDLAQYLEYLPILNCTIKDKIGNLFSPQKADCRPILFSQEIHFPPVYIILQ